MVKTLVRKVADNLYLLRLDDDKVRYFEGIWYIPEGITYNAYLLTLQDKNVLIDAWKHTYAEEFVSTLKEIIEPRDIDYIIVQHMEQDHSGALPKVLEENGQRAEVLGHPIARGMIESFYGIKPRFRAVSDGEELKVGDEVLKFFYTPWLHWPDNIMTYVASSKVLFSSDAFGSYSIPSVVFDDGVTPTYLSYARKYFATVIGHYREHVPKALSKLEKAGVDIRVIAPAHGLLWRRNPKEIIDYYVRWARAEGEEGKVLVLYASMYGFVERAVTVVAEELARKGLKVVTHSFTDTQQAALSDLISDVLDAQAVVIGVSTYEAGAFPTIEYVTNLLARKVAAEKPVLIITSYGWGGAAGRKVADTLSTAGFNIINIVEIRGMPSSTDIVKLKEAAAVLARELGR